MGIAMLNMVTSTVMKEYEKEESTRVIVHHSKKLENETVL
jgi:hypothetical protein